MIDFNTIQEWVKRYVSDIATQRALLQQLLPLVYCEQKGLDFDQVQLVETRFPDAIGTRWHSEVRTDDSRIYLEEWANKAEA